MQGPSGPPGANGSQGPVGPTGPTGSQGADAAVPAGTIVAFGGPGVPVGRWLPCVGGTLRRGQDGGKFDELFTALGETWGNGGDSNPYTVSVPDLRGMFLRGAHGDVPSSHPDPGPRSGTTFEVGSLQSDGIGPHSHRLQKVHAPGGCPARVTAAVGTGEGNVGDGTQVFWGWTLPGGTTVGTETRPKKAAGNGCLRY